MTSKAIAAIDEAVWSYYFENYPDDISWLLNGVKMLLMSSNPRLSGDVLIHQKGDVALWSTYSTASQTAAPSSQSANAHGAQTAPLTHKG